MIKTAHSVAELRNITEEILRKIARTRTADQATVVWISGDLGAGKTAFVKCAADILGIQETITSPTFILEKIYTISKNPIFGERFSRFIHIDAYRLESGNEMHALDWGTIIHDPQNIIFIEWPEQVAEVMPQETFSLFFEYVDEHTRNITF